MLYCLPISLMHSRKGGYYVVAVCYWFSLSSPIMKHACDVFPFWQNTLILCFVWWKYFTTRNLLTSDIDRFHWIFLPQKCNTGVSLLHARHFCPLFGSKLHLCCCYCYNCPISPSLGVPHTLLLLYTAQFQRTSMSVDFQWIPQSACVCPIWFAKLVGAKIVSFIHFLILRSCK